MQQTAQDLAALIALTLFAATVMLWLDALSRLA